jgi:ferrochelatase
MPFLENVLRGKNVPRERMLAVAEHYYHFGGVSPINAQNQALIDALRNELRGTPCELPLYWGNRNWRPLLPDALREMRNAGVRKALAIFTSAYSSYSGCRQYRENIAQAQATIGADTPQIDRLRFCFNHPGFIAAQVERVQDAIAQLPPPEQATAQLWFTAHSIPNAMADHCDYEKQLRETARLVAEAVGRTDWRLVFQSRSGPPSQPWLEPDVLDALQQHADRGERRAVVLAPIGFLSDHLEVLYDLDTEAVQKAAALSIPLARAGTVGTHPRFVRMLRELIEERMLGGERLACGSLGPSHDVCPENCCRYEPRRPGPT